MVWRTHLIVVGVVALLHIGCQSNPASSSLLPDTGTTEDAAAATDTPAPELDSGHMDVSNDTVGDAENQQPDPSLFVRGSMNLNVHWDIREDSGAVWVEGGDIVVQALSDFPESSTVESPQVEIEIWGRVLLEGAWCVRGRIRRPAAPWTDFDWQCRVANGNNVVVMSQDDRLRATLQVSQVSEF